MNIILQNRLVNAFKNKAKYQSCYNQEGAIQLLFAIFEAMQSEISESEMLEIHQMFTEKLTEKTNWGYKQLTTELSRIVADL